MDVNEILKKYGKKLDEEVRNDILGGEPSVFDRNSSEFAEFKSEMLPKFSRYERWCQSFGNVIKLKLAFKDEQRIGAILSDARLGVEPGQVVGLAFMGAFGIFFASLILTASIYLFGLGFPLMLLFLGLVTSIFIFYYFYTMPQRLANEWKLKASSQMIPCILYTVVYMKHTSNLERAIRFAADHLEPPLSLDFKKVFWDVQVGKFSTIKESLDNYLETWRGYSTEFVESFNLIESSLYEPSEVRRVAVLERALQVILEGVYDQMLKFTHSVKAPLTNIYMLGIVLPTLGLALLPLASTLLEGMIKWYHVMILFNIFVPFLVFYMTSEILMKRPGGYGESSNLELNPLYPRYKSKSHYIKAALIAIPFILIGLLPFAVRYGLFGLKDVSFSEIGLSFFGNIKFFEFVKASNGSIVGPMGVVALILSLCIPLGIYLFFSVSYGSKTKEIIKSRDYTRNLEKEFNNSLFKLGNRVGDGTPAELVFGKVAESSRGMVTENFFRMVHSNIHNLGMSLERAIFDMKRGAIIYYPSTLIATSMHIFVESVKKGLKVAAESLMSISEYIGNINKIEDRLRDLLADVVSDMRSNMVFLAPLLAGIVVGLGSMITLILSKLTSIISDPSFSTGGGIGGLGGVTNILDFFKLEGMMPPYFLQVVIGIYIAQIIIILTKALVTVDSGSDELKETNEISKNMIRGGVLYLIVALASIIILGLIAIVAISGLGI